MFIAYTYQDYLRASESERLPMLLDIIKQYKASDDFQRAIITSRYFNSQNDAINKKVMLQQRFFKGENGKVLPAQKEIIGNRISSNFLFRFVVQQNQFLLGNGVTLQDAETKVRLGTGFDKLLEQAGEKALLHGVCWGFWNKDHVELIQAAANELSGFVALLDERTGEHMLGVQFWQIDAKRPLYVRVFEMDGVTEYVQQEKEDALRLLTAKQPYKTKTYTDAAGVVAAEGINYNRLPLVPFYANNEHRSEFSDAIKSKIDIFDRIFSDFGDNLERANDVYWVLNNFGGTMDEVRQMISQINELRAIVNVSDGMGGGSSAQPYAFEVPYEARKTALELLQKELYSDYMGLNMDEITGGSLTNVAIDVATMNLNLKADRYEWQAFAFVQGILQLAGVTSERIRFKRQSITNRSETVQDIRNMREDIDLETALKLNPYIDQEEIPEIIKRRNAEDTGFVAEYDDTEEADV